MNRERLFHRFAEELEDFWGRRQNRPAYSRDFTICGHTVHLASNDERLLAAADHAQHLYSSSAAEKEPSFAIQLVIQPMPFPPGSVPDNLFDHIQYTGDAGWLALHLGAWGHCQVDLARKRAVAVLAPELAEHPALVSRYLLNTILTNFLIASGYGFLHATGLLKEGRVILLMAPHNSGKSTTALRLALSGYRLLSDSMIFIDNHSPPHLFGFPVGRLKLRPDMVAEFPQLSPFLGQEPARGEIKYALDLREMEPGLVHESAVQPSEISLCLLARRDQASSRVRPASQDELAEAIMANSLFYDTAEVWEQNLARIQSLVAQAELYHLVIGNDPDQIVSTIDALWH